MELSHARRLARGATGYDQEAIALLILLPPTWPADHYAAAFEREGRGAAMVSPAKPGYD